MGGRQEARRGCLCVSPGPAARRLGLFRISGPTLRRFRGAISTILNSSREGGISML